ncbi:molybdate ABC transporter substrate-binding protein [Congregibacter brevis]|uniref:Molybdate ABC transporter substrate-binding protein n=1 Tax=Congregibacter brevis TaxID=3081201 RepID=A0ABZ0ICH7_9GAMM|nr:molybdate ABC transporter substrate-binding protein [Congregibacter sp. IMCC45268]
MSCPNAVALTYNARMQLTRLSSSIFTRAINAFLALQNLALTTQKTTLSVLLIAMLVASKALTADTGFLNIAVASNFRATAEEISKDFSAKTGVKVRVSSASTGVLAAQIRRGAPYDVLLAADHARPQALVDDGTSSGPASCYAQGSLVLLGADSIEDSLSDAAQSIAIANPRSAPYGAAALTVLARDGFTSAEDRRTVRGSNVLQALQFYASGGADLALVARSLSPMEGLPIPISWHAPIEQYAVINARSQNLRAAQEFLEYLSEPAVESVLTSFGYSSCS